MSARPTPAGELDSLFHALGLSVRAPQAAALETYLDLLGRWNATYNLTSVRDRASMRSQHLADCLAVVSPLRSQLAAGRILDVGSGGGLPGVVLAILNPDWQVTTVDTVGKKAAFVRQVAGSLQLPNLRAEHARVEQLKLPAFDVITSRAFATLKLFTDLTAPLLAPQGVWMAMKGKHPGDEMAELPPSVSVFHVEPLQVPTLDAERCLVWMRHAAA